VAANNFAAAASILSDVAQSAPVAAVYNNLGIAYANSNDIKHAEEAFHEAVDKDPNDRGAWMSLGLVQQKENNLDDALVSFQKVPDLAARQIKAIGALKSGHDILSVKPIALDAGRQDSIASGRVDYFSFVTPHKYRDLVVISMTNRSTTLAPLLRIFNADKSDISGEQHNDTSGGNLAYTFAAQPNSTYYMSVQGSQGTAGDYTLLVKPSRAYRYEPNDDILRASPVDPSKPIEANIMDKQDADYYQFRSAAQAGNIEVSLANGSATLAPLLRIFNADKSDISGGQHNDTSGGNLTYTFAAQPNSTYCVSVQGSWGTAGNYTLTLKYQ
jgi:tetratricopeptide (TPR) repeat protein